MPRPMFRSPEQKNSQNQQTQFLNTRQVRQTRQLSKMEIDRLLRKPRSKKYMEAIRRLDAGGHVTNQTKVNEMLAAIREEFPELEDPKTGRSLMDPSGADTGRYIPVKETVTYRDLLTHNSINCSSVVVKREAALEFPMEHDDSHEDYITWLKILKKYGPAVGINRPYLKYRLSEGGKSRNKLKSAKMTYHVYRYVGYGPLKSACFFVSYALHGIWKYR